MSHPVVTWHYFVLLACYLLWLPSVLGWVTLHWAIIDGLNSRRSEKDRIPITNERLEGRAWWITQFGKHGPFFWYRVLMPAYRREFPASRVPAWYIACVVAMCINVVISLVLLEKWIR